LKNGKISDEEIMQPLSPEGENELIRVIKAMPRCKFGTQLGKPVKAFFTLPIKV
jgi:hypothetical protein